SDAFGRRPIYVLDVALFALGSLMAALAPAFPLLLVGRSIQGLGAGGIFPVASAVIGDTFPPDRRGRALGLIGAVFGLAFLIGPILGGILLRFGWPWLFLLNLPIAAVVIGLSWRLLPSVRPDRRRPFDWTGMITLSVMLACLAYGLNQVDTRAIFASLVSPTVGPFLGGAVLLVLPFWWAEQRAPDPILRPTLFRTRQAILAGGLSAGAGLGEAGLVFLPSLAVAALGVEKHTASFLLMPMVLAMAVGSPLVGRLLDQWGSKVVILAGSLLLTWGMILLGFLSAQLGFFLLAGVIVGLGLSALLGAPVRYIMLNEAPPRDRAAAQGAITLFTSIGQLVGGALVGAVAASQGGGVTGYQAAYLVVAAIALLLTVMAVGLKSRAQEMATQERLEAAGRPDVRRAGQPLGESDG
ncbi:MAG: MFS transporter, partial [Chloroflexi bacterium]